MILLLALSAEAYDPAIETHLYAVVDTLRAETPADLPADVRARRLAYLDALEQYAAAGEYPRHTGPLPKRTRAIEPPRHFQGWDTAPRQPVFVDDAGAHCAVGYLMGIDHPELVDRIVAEDNPGWLPEMDVDGVEAWATDAGFTLDELAWIQPSYRHSVPDCAGYTPSTGPSGRISTCDGPDVAPVRVVWSQVGCHEGCEPGDAAQVWFPVENLDDAEATAVTVTARALDAAGVPQDPPQWTDTLTIPASDALLSGPLSVTDNEQLRLGWEVTATIAGDCDTANDVDIQWSGDPSDSGLAALVGCDSGWFMETDSLDTDLPGLGDSTPDTDPLVDSDPPPVDTDPPPVTDTDDTDAGDTDEPSEDEEETEGCGDGGCSDSGTAPMAAVWVVALVAAARRFGGMA